MIRLIIRELIGVISIILAIFIAGCGSNNSSKDNPTPPPQIKLSEEECMDVANAYISAYIKYDISDDLVLKYMKNCTDQDSKESMFAIDSRQWKRKMEVSIVPDWKYDDAQKKRIIDAGNKIREKFEYKLEYEEVNASTGVVTIKVKMLDREKMQRDFDAFIVSESARQFPNMFNGMTRKQIVEQVTQSPRKTNLNYTQFYNMVTDGIVKIYENPSFADDYNIICIRLHKNNAGLQVRGITPNMLYNTFWGGDAPGAVENFKIKISG